MKNYGLIVKQTFEYNKNDRLALERCRLCPRNCGVNRFIGGDGYCGVNSGFNISSVCIHRGEEPSISGTEGICNIFFTGCNLHCSYCQNYEISRNESLMQNYEFDLGNVLGRIEKILSTGINTVGFVSPSHVVPQVRAIINGLNMHGFRPVTVYNTNSYDRIETIRSLSGLIDVYLPDYKYVTPELASELSDAYDYPAIALTAIKEMYYQKGSTLWMDESGKAESGLLIRHLVLPGFADESKKVLRTIAEELSPGVNLSLMSQYHPISCVNRNTVLNRLLFKEEYKAVVEEMKNLGFRNGWIQDMDSATTYRPDFRRDNPFE